MNRELIRASETNSRGHSALRREREVWVDEQGLRYGSGEERRGVAGGRVQGTANWAA